MNVLLRLLIGTGQLPEDVREELEAEGVVVLEEGLSGSLTLRSYRAPGRRAGGHRGRSRPCRGRSP